MAVIVDNVERSQQPELHERSIRLCSDGPACQWRPFMSTTAATFTSRCVSTPPTTRRAESTMATATPFYVEGQARTSREADQ